MQRPAAWFRATHPTTHLTSSGGQTHVWHKSCQRVQPEAIPSPARGATLVHHALGDYGSTALPKSEGERSGHALGKS